ncbi:MAG: LacI family DNA-binding transcriptional regulator [Opitutales bacterium]
MDIAARAGVSQTTVSRALRKDRRIKRSTRERIEQLAEAMGYHRNSLVAGFQAELKNSRRGGERPNLRAVAQKAGVSPGTVSRALGRDADKVLPATRKRVEAAAAELGYAVHPLHRQFAQSLRRGHARAPTETLAFLGHWPMPDGWTGHPIFRRYYEGALNQARAQGFRVDHFMFHNPEMSPERLSQILETRNIRGLLFFPHKMIGPSAPVPSGKFCVCTMAPSVYQADQHRVTLDLMQNLYDALLHLLSTGARRIAVLPQNCLADPWSGIQFQAATSLLEKDPKAHDLKVRIIPVGPERPKQLQERDWDGILHEFNTPAEWEQFREDQGLGAIHHRSFNWNPAWQGYPGMDQNFERIGTVAVDSLIARIWTVRDPASDPPRLTLIRGTWHEG